MKNSLCRPFGSLYLNFDPTVPLLGIYCTEKSTKISRDCMSKDDHAKFVVIENIRNKKMSIMGSNCGKIHTNTPHNHYEEIQLPLQLCSVYVYTL